MKQSSTRAAAYAVPLFTLLVMISVLTLGASNAWAYEAYSSGRDSGYCADCHGDFRANPYISLSDGANWGDDLHDVHRSGMLSGDCATCHQPGPRFPVLLDDSDGGNGLEPISCVGCHGREGDIGNDSESTGWGAGLRQHHTNAGVQDCAGCHSDADPSNYTPLGEDTLPVYYANPGTGHPLIPSDPCNPNGEEGAFAGTLLGLDNDGDGIYDAADPDCVPNDPPVADPNGPYTGTVGLPVQFDGSGSSDPDGTIVAYDWDFGDGNTGAGINPAHSYAAAGTFTVTLTVTDNDGATDSAGSTATINAVPNEPPVADPNGPYTGTVGLPVQFDGSGSSDPDGTIVAYDWDFGDGNTGAGINPTHSYAAAGTFTVTLTVTDNDGATDSAGSTATINAVPNEPPVADPNGPYTGTVGLPVQFDGSGSSDPDGTIVAYDWDFGDGNTGAGINPAHSYAAAGTFTVTLTVTDNDGATDSAGSTATINAVPNEPPVADPNGPYTGTVGLPVQFDGSGSSDPDGTIVAYDWDFGDGNTGAGINPAHSYAAAGTFTVTLTVTDNDGATDSAGSTATINAVPNEPPVADPNGPYTGTVGLPVQFDGSGSSDPDGTIVAYDWDFGDGNTGAGINPAHSYAAAGTFTVTLTVTDNDGATDSAGSTATIDPLPDLLDLDATALRVTKRVSLTRVKPVALTLVVQNTGTVEGTALATIIGMQNGVEVYHQTLTVTDAAGNGRTTYDDGSVPPIPSFVPATTGDILWKVTMVDGDPDTDEITAVTRVVP